MQPAASTNIPSDATGAPRLNDARPTSASPFPDAEQRELRLAQGTIRYRVLGNGEPIVLVHGLLTSSLLWTDVAPMLAEEFRVIAPDWPLGSHQLPLHPGSDLGPPGLARLIADFISALELEHVTLVGNDTGGALCQLVVVNHPERIARLVLTPCDAYENFLPPMFRPLQLAARIPGAVWLIANALRPRFAQRLPFAFGWLSKRPLDRELAGAFMRPVLTDRRIRRELAATLRAIDNRYTLEAAERFPQFDKPVLLAWAPEDRFFKLHYAERMARAFPRARLEPIENSYTFVPIDQPRRTAELIASFAAQPRTPAGAPGAQSQ
jgi:pimeloyl-ACP methyl ester carboxylesterase